MWMSVSIFVIRKYKTPIKFIKIVRRVKELKNRYNFENGYKKVAYVDGRTFISPNNNGWPAKHFNRLIDIEARTALNDNVSNLEQLNIVLIALTKKCPLNCEHCYEADELNKRDTLTLEDHKKILKKVQDAGIPMIQYGGGDPMAKVNDLGDPYNCLSKDIIVQIGVNPKYYPIGKSKKHIAPYLSGAVNFGIAKEYGKDYYVQSDTSESLPYQYNPSTEN